MSCKAFLRSFAYQYCRHKYIRNVVRTLSQNMRKYGFRHHYLMDNLAFWARYA